MITIIHFYVRLIAAVKTPGQKGKNSGDSSIRGKGISPDDELYWNLKSYLLAKVQYTDFLCREIYFSSVFFPNSGSTGINLVIKNPGIIVSNIHKKKCW